MNFLIGFTSKILIDNLLLYKIMNIMLQAFILII